MIWLHEVSVDELELVVRAHHVFRDNGITTVGQLDNMTDAELLRLKNFGRDTLRKTRDAVDSFRQEWHERWGRGRLNNNT